MAMEKFADALADGVRANAKMERRAEKAPATAKQQIPGQYGRRLDERHQTEVDFRHDRRERQRRSSVRCSSDLAGIAELEGDAVFRPAPQRAEDVCLWTAGEMMHSQSALPSNLESAKEDTATANPLKNVTAETRMRLTSATTPREAEKAMRKAKRTVSGPLPDTTTETRMLMVGLISQSEVERERENQHARQPSSGSKFRELGISPGNRRTDDHSIDNSIGAVARHEPATPRKIGALTLRKPTTSLSVPVRKISPRKSLFVPANAKEVKVKGTSFDLLPSPKKVKATPPIPLRTTSKHFSLTLDARQRISTDIRLSLVASDTKSKATFMSLPIELRNRVYRHLVICHEHQVFVCDCGLCSWSASTQPALSRVSRQLRAEVLPLYYGENKFIIRGAYNWSKKAPAWLRTLSQDSRDMIRHLEISTNDITSAVCMMATLGFKLSHRLPAKEHIAVMHDMRDATIWMTFTAINHRPRAFEGLPEIRSVPAIELWDGGEVKRLSAMSFDDNLTEISDADTFRLLDDADAQSITTIATGILDTDRNSRYSGVIEQGTMARLARGKVVAVPASPKLTKEDELDQIVGMLFKRRSMGQRAVKTPRRYSIGREVVQRVGIEK